jgi:restriction system protein
MAIPDYQTLMTPIMRFIDDGNEHSLRETINEMAENFSLTVEERKELLPSGKQTVIANRVAWAVTYLRKTKLLENTKRGVFKITARGKKALADHPDRIDNRVLIQFEEFVEFQTRSNKVAPIKDTEKSKEPNEKNPEEALEAAHQELQDGLAVELLDTIKQCSPEFFEQLVVDVLIRMGYGGSRKEAGQAIGKSGDGGIDGIIKEDKLGLDIIFLQAKRWDSTVGRPDIQKFAGALQGQRARKGIFITTSNYSKEALEFVKHIDNKIILIDGQQLAEIMITYNVGVSTEATYEIKKIDSDYFIDE